MFTRDEKRKAAERELGLRQRVYPRWVEAGKMSQAKAEREIAIMREIAEDYGLPIAVPESQPHDR